jgi:hypothetical protein
VLAGLVACGDNVPPPQPDVLAQLRALPQVADATEQPTSDEGYRYIVVHFIQAVDHDDPTSATFLQEVSLLQRDVAAPMIVHTSGYWDYYLDREVELTQLLGANQISIEHRYFGTSRPDPADWSKLTIAQMAADEHEIVTALRTIYHGAFVSTGGSKGGMTAMFFRRFFPDDVDGTVAYVAPIMFGTPDPRFPAWIDTLGPADCHAQVRAVATEMLANRRAALELRAQAQATTKGYTYTRVLLGPAVETAIEAFEWYFWQYSGVAACTAVPAVTASDDDLFAFLDAVSPVSSSDDQEVARFEAFVYQSFFQLGYPDDGTTYLKPYYKYTDADFAGELPTPAPTYDGGAAMHDVQSFVTSAIDRVIFVYGGWDPWTGGRFAIGTTFDTLELTQAMGTHGSSLSHLAPDDRAAAFALLAGWTGVTPAAPPHRIVEPPLPRMPPSIARALR